LRIFSVGKVEATGNGRTKKKNPDVNSPQKSRKIMKNNITNRTGSKFTRALLIALCFGMVFGVSTMAHADLYWWLRRWW
jgi:hypothetical protein